MHKKLLKELGKHLDVAKVRNPALYRQTEANLSQLDNRFHSNRSVVPQPKYPAAEGHVHCGVQHYHGTQMHNMHACPKCGTKCPC